MTISELSAGQGNVNVGGIITEVGEAKTFNKFGKELKVSNAILKDDSGTIKLTLWNDEASKFKEGDEVKIENGYVNEFQGEPQLTAGKFGKIEKVGEGESGDSESGTTELPSEDKDSDDKDSDDKESKDESFLEKAEDKIKEVAEDVKEKVEEVVDKIKGDDKDKEEDKKDSEDQKDF